MKPSSDVAFSAAVKQVQSERGSRAAYERMERSGGFETVVTDDLRAFLAVIDTAFLATASRDGQPYIQHRGGAPGFIRAVDDHTLAFLDLAGNRQYVSIGNLGENDRVCLFLIDYARCRRVKVWGTAEVVPLSAELLAALGPAPPARPEQVVRVTVTAWDRNCAQHIPQKLDLREIAPAIEALRLRIGELEGENAQLRAAARATLAK